MTPKNIHTILIPQKYPFFYKPPKNIEIQNFEPQKMARAYICIKISENLGMDSDPTPIRRRFVVGNISLKQFDIFQFRM